MKKSDIFENYEKYIMPTYTRTPLIFVKGKGMDLTDINGKKYLDFFPGWAVSNVGHCNPKVMAGVRDQVDKLIHLPNNFYHPSQAKLAKEIIRNAFAGKVFFCNSGAEACEAAIKFARVYGKGHRHEIITMQQSFHGRTMGALTATGQPKHQEGFSPLVPGFSAVPFNDIKAVEAAITDKTIAIMLELIQGEGGVRMADLAYVKALRALCDAKDILLIFDEVQTGMGRTGSMFAYQHYGVEPDLMMLAKALGGGLPIGVLVANERLANTFQPGMHASTFGGGPLVCKAALGVFKAIHSKQLLPHAKAMGKIIMEKLCALKEQYACIKEIRGVGLMIAMELNMPGVSLIDACLKKGLILNCTQGSVIRIMPALNVTRKQIDTALYILEKALASVTTTEESI